MADQPAPVPVFITRASIQREALVRCQGHRTVATVGTEGKMAIPPCNEQLSRAY